MRANEIGLLEGGLGAFTAAATRPGDHLWGSREPRFPQLVDRGRHSEKALNQML